MIYVRRRDALDAMTPLLRRRIPRDYEYMVLPGRTQRLRGKLNFPPAHHILNNEGPVGRALTPLTELEAWQDPEVGLAARAQRGDREALSLLLQGMERRLYAGALSILGNAHDAADAVSATFLSVIDSIGTLRHPDRFASWTYRIMLNHALGEKRRSRKGEVLAGDLSDDRTTGSRHGSTPDHSSSAAQRVDLEQAVALLSEDHRTAVVLRYVLDLPLDDIARVTGVPLGTIKSRLHWALRRLADHLGEHPSPGEGRK